MLAELARRLLRRPAPLPRNLEFESPASLRRYRGRPRGRTAADSAGGETIVCPRCSHRAALEPLVCARCGFPFICDVGEVDAAAQRRRSVGWRTVLAAGALLFWISSAAAVISGRGDYMGQTTSVVMTLRPDTDSGIPIAGPASFVTRTQLVLDLLEKRAPDFYFRVTEGITSIEFLDKTFLESEAGRSITLEGIGAVSTPSTGRVQVLSSTAFPSGLGELVDADIFSYAGVLVHELRHIELHRSGQAPGGWEEEVLCEQAAYEAVKQLGAPGVVLARYELYLHNPHAKRYQDWYRWYDQF
jgi:ribosomal protein L37E